MREDDEKKSEEWLSQVIYGQHPSLRKLCPLEKQFLLAVEHGDIARVGRILHMVNRNPSLPMDINCKDPVGRSGTLLAIDNENLDMLEYLLECGAECRDALLHAINAEYVEAVDLLLEHEEAIHKNGEKHSWEKVDRDISTFTPEITPLILAAHKDNYEILKILLDRGSTLPMPHDVRCCCSDCAKALDEDCLYHSRSRINAYRALSSPSLICLSSIDPILTAFELSWELRRLSNAENEFKEDYVKLRSRCQDFATHLLDHVRSSRELEMVLNYDPTHPPYQQEEHMPLARLQMAIKYKQKKFIAHPNVQQLLSSLWYDGLQGFRKQNSIYQLWDITKIGVLFPFYSLIYMLFPYTKAGKLIGKPFFKFIIHSFSYLFFLFLLILASQRVETLVVQWFGTEEMRLESLEAMKMQRGQPPSIIETSILLYIIAHIWQETRELWIKGLVTYFQNMWNIIDFTRNSLYVGTVIMRVWAYFQAQAEISENPLSVYIPREEWNPYDPMLIADGLFAAGNVFAALKLVHIFSINPYLGPLQISLGRMVIDIIKFFFIYALVLFSFACGLNQLLWYYSDKERQQCFSGPGGTENWMHQRDSCLAWRRFSNLFESSQTLFWASFGLVDISNFDLSGIKSYTRFWGLLMFGSYSVINVVVLLNLLIAMMSNSYNVISERADVEWKFARTTLFMNYFEDGSTVPPPFNIFPAVKHIMRLFGHKESKKNMSIRGVMCNLVWRYVTAQQKSNESHAVTEDNINELRQDVYSFRHDLMSVLRGNGMNTQNVEKEKVDVSGKRVQVRKRRLIKDFSIGLMEVCTEEAAPEVLGNKSMLARLVRLSGGESRGSQRWRDLIQAVKKTKSVGNNHDNKNENGSVNFHENYSSNLQGTATSECQRSEQKIPDSSKNMFYPKISEESRQRTGTESHPVPDENVSNNLYPNISEDLANTALNLNTPAVMSPEQMSIPENVENKLKTNDSFQAKTPGVQPTNAIKHPTTKKKEAPAVPKAIVGKVTSEQNKYETQNSTFNPAVKNVSHAMPQMISSRQNTPEHRVAAKEVDRKALSEKQVPKDIAVTVTTAETTAITVNPFPEDQASAVDVTSCEKINHPRAESFVSVDVVHRFNSPELIDFKENEVTSPEISTKGETKDVKKREDWNSDGKEEKVFSTVNYSLTGWEVERPHCTGTVKEKETSQIETNITITTTEEETGVFSDSLQHGWL